MMTTQTQLHGSARRLFRLLQEHDRRIVFAESCTGGLVSATLTRIAGVATYHCGSAVVYQVETKAAWLRVPKRLLEKPGPVSREVAREMAERVLAETPHADLAVSVTGHLGPDAPKSQDGLLYAAVASRRGASPSTLEKTVVRKHRLEQGPVISARDSRNLRIRRQISAAFLVLSLAADFLERS